MEWIPTTSADTSSPSATRPADVASSPTSAASSDEYLAYLINSHARKSRRARGLAATMPAWRLFRSIFA